MVYKVNKKQKYKKREIFYQPTILDHWKVWKKEKRKEKRREKTLRKKRSVWKREKELFSLRLIHLTKVVNTTINRC